jgi:predicted metal-dependent phosphoesterase TrpH
MFGGADLHSHSKWSDGLDTPRGLVRKALAAGLSAIALSDHDTVQGVNEFENACCGSGLIPVPSVELSTRSGGDGVHLLGLFIDPSFEPFRSQLERFQVGRAERGEEMVRLLSSLGVSVDLAGIRRTVGDGSFGRPHIARAMVECHAVATEDEAFSRFLGRGGPAWIPKPKWEVPEAIEAIRAAGGLSVIAHPITLKDPHAVLLAGEKAGLDGLEVSHSDQSESDEKTFRLLASRLDLLVTAGSDHHGLNGKRTLGGRRLTREDWELLCDAAQAARRAAGRAPVDLSPR